MFSFQKLLRDPEVCDTGNANALIGAEVRTWLRRSCANENCPAVGKMIETEQVEKFPLLTAEVTAESMDAQNVLSNLEENIILKEGTECDQCKARNEVHKRTEISRSPQVLCFGLNRSGRQENGRQLRNECVLDCNRKVEFHGRPYVLAAAVEHISDSGNQNADGGHYKAWTCHGHGRHQCDDAVVTEHATLPASVAANVVLLVYECSSNTSPQSVTVGEAGAEGAQSVSSEVQQRKKVRKQRKTRRAGGQGLLGETPNGEMEVDEAVNRLLETYLARGDCNQVLSNLPSFSCEVADASWSSLVKRMGEAVRQYVGNGLVAADAVHLTVPLWRTTFFPLLVLFEAWSRATGMPTVFYVDAFLALASSLINKHVAYRVANFQRRSRYWVAGTAAPGSGKSPALDPLKEALIDVRREMTDLAPGRASDGFHVQPLSTHLAAVDRLRTTGGYEFFGAGEGGPLLCPSWPQSSTWNQGTHINWQRYLDAATGA